MLSGLNNISYGVLDVRTFLRKLYRQKGEQLQELSPCC